MLSYCPTNSFNPCEFHDISLRFLIVSLAFLTLESLHSNPNRPIVFMKQIISYLNVITYETQIWNYLHRKGLLACEGGSKNSQSIGVTLMLLTTDIFVKFVTSQVHPFGSEQVAHVINFCRSLQLIFFIASIQVHSFSIFIGLSISPPPQYNHKVCTVHTQRSRWKLLCY